MDKFRLTVEKKTGVFPSRTSTFDFSNNGFRQRTIICCVDNRLCSSCSHLDRTFTRITGHPCHCIPFLYRTVDLRKLFDGGHRHWKFPHTGRKRLVLCFLRHLHFRSHIFRTTFRSTLTKKEVVYNQIQPNDE